MTREPESQECRKPIYGGVNRMARACNLKAGHDGDCQVILFDNARLAPQDAGDEWRVGYDDRGPVVEKRWRNFWNVMQAGETVEALNALEDELEQLRPRAALHCAGCDGCSRIDE